MGYTDNLQTNGKWNGKTSNRSRIRQVRYFSPKGEYWNPSTISSITKNEVYLGHIIWGKIRYTKQNGKYIRKKVPKERWQRHDNAHPPLVSEELFQK
ncbi:recombinase family protein [Bacillus sp. OR9]|nr:recombinase family protein [Bacillus sp. OR9]